VKDFHDCYSYKPPLHSLYRDLALYLDAISAYTFDSHAEGSDNEDIAEGSVSRRTNLLGEARRSAGLGSKSCGRPVDLKQLGEVRRPFGIDYTQTRRHAHNSPA